MIMLWTSNTYGQIRGVTFTGCSPWILRLPFFTFFHGLLLLLQNARARSVSILHDLLAERHVFPRHGVIVVGVWIRENRIVAAKFGPGNVQRRRWISTASITVSRFCPFRNGVRVAARTLQNAAELTAWWGNTGVVCGRCGKTRLPSKSFLQKNQQY